MDALQNLDQVVEEVLALVVEERHREAIPPSAACPANAVDITLDLLRHVIVDEELDAGDVQPRLESTVATRIGVRPSRTSLRP